VTDLPAPTATRLTRARWLDARLLIGLLLVLLSVVIGAKVVADADQRVQVWSVTHDLGADTPLSGDDLQAASVNLDDATGRYLAASEDLDGLVLTRPVGRGELLPVTAVGRADPTQRRRIVIEVDRSGWPGWTRARWSTSMRCPRLPAVSRRPGRSWSSTASRSART
jgi:flagella basal body P-ring formation protein FlgA